MDSAANWTPQEERMLARHLIERVCERCSGTGGGECLRNLPRDVYFVGSLRPRPAEGDSSPFGGELSMKMAPVAFGLELQLRLPPDTDAALCVHVEWNCYYRVFPTLEQQREHQPSGEARRASSDRGSDAVRRRKSPAPEEDETDDGAAGAEEEPVLERRAPRNEDSLFMRFRQLRCSAEGRIGVKHHNGTYAIEKVALERALQEACQQATTHVCNDPERLRTHGDPEAQVQVPPRALESEAALAAFRASLTTEVVPAWSWEVQTDTRRPVGGPRDDVVIVSVRLTNASAPDRIEYREGRTRPRQNCEPFLFSTGLSVSLDGGSVIPFEMKLAPRGFRYDPALWARGLNCGVETRGGSGVPQVFATTHVPIHEQPRFSTREEPATPFLRLVENPAVVLEGVLQAMADYRSVWEHERAEWCGCGADWEASHGQEFDADHARFAEETDRFRQGVELVQTDADVRLAFELANQVFETCREGGAWRLFQLVFFVSQIPDTARLAGDRGAAMDTREVVDIIHAPTGSGKTEAYLAAIVFHCFFDRLRGKTAGVTAWMRFPLRLLTVQQTQRVADVIGIAELVRRQASDPRLSGAEVDGFGVGYFVGKEATPNEIYAPYGGAPPEPDWEKANDPSGRRDWNRVPRCPWCRGFTVEVDFDPVTTRIIHRCSNPNCAFPAGELPVHVVDNEVYRYLPSVIVGTIDKLAALGNQRKMSMLLGSVDGRCSVHGYYLGECCQKGCRDAKQLTRGVPRGMSGPTLFVQDELHLLKEGLGTFDSHYETFTQALLRRFGNDAPVKVIASTATVEAYDRQVQHLYGRRPGCARVFPGEGPKLGSSFYSWTQDHPQRVFAGLLPHNKTVFNAMLELLQYYHEEVQRLGALGPGEPNPYGGDVEPATSMWDRLLDLYATSLTYFLKTSDLDGIRHDLDTHTNSELEATGLLPLRLHELSGSVPTWQVAKVLTHLESPRANTEPPDAVVATSMVSHGVDVDRLNAMFFYGMPRNTAEYIQASSRVGRKHVGAVFVCFNPPRERDQSHYSYFAKNHEFLGQMVEPVAINRWARFGVRRTLPGLFMGYLLQCLSRERPGRRPSSYYFLSDVQQMIHSGSLSAQEIVDALRDAYLAQAESGIADAFEEEIRDGVSRALDHILAASGDQTFVSDALAPSPMRSLREVDEQLPIELDFRGSEWGRRSEYSGEE